MESTCTPMSSHAWSTGLMARTPARWPNVAGRPRRRAQRPLPSMMIPTWRGTCESTGEERVPTGIKTVRPLYLHHLVLFAVREGVDLLDLGFGDLLQPARPALRLVLGHLALFLHVIHAVELVAADVANRDARFFRLLADELHVLPAALLGKGRDGHSDDLAVTGWIEALLTRAQRLLDRPHLALVVDLHHQQARFRSADLGELVQRRRGAVVRDHDLVDQRRVRPAGPDRRELGREMVDGLAHLGLRVAKYRVDHEAELTSVPISSPRTTRSMFPGVRRLKTTMGTLLSMQSVSAVLSITSMPRLSTSR